MGEFPENADPIGGIWRHSSPAYTRTIAQQSGNPMFCIQTQRSHSGVVSVSRVRLDSSLKGLNDKWAKNCLTAQNSNTWNQREDQHWSSIASSPHMREPNFLDYRHARFSKKWGSTSAYSLTYSSLLAQRRFTVWETSWEDALTFGFPSPHYIHHSDLTIWPESST